MSKRNAPARKGPVGIFDQWGASAMAYVIIAVASIIVYGQNLGFTVGKFDEDVIITFNEKLLKNSSNAIEVLKRDAFFNNPGRNFYRPVQNFSYFIDTQIGKGKSWAYYVMNLLLHITTCILLFRTLKDLNVRAGTALASTMLYVTSPLFVHAIAWVPGRGDLLIAMFALLCLRATFRFLDTRKTSSLVALHAFFALSMFSKETSVLIPLAITAAWWFFYPQREETKKTLLIALLPCIIPIALFFFTRSLVIPKFPAATVFGIGPFLNNLRVIPESIGKFIIPIGLAPLPAFTLLVTGLGAVLSVGLIAAAWRFADDHQRKLVLFGLGWFLLFTIPGTAYTNELGDIAYDYLEHRSYLPMIGIVMIIGVIIAKLFDGARRESASFGVAAVIIIFGGMSFLHAKNYKNPELFYDMAVEGNPHSGMALLNRGYLNATKRKTDAAIRDYTLAATECPTYAEPLVNRGVLYQELRRNSDAGVDFKEAVRRNPKLFAAHYNLANWYSGQEDLPNALRAYEDALNLRPNFAEGWAMIASIKAKSGNLDGAMPYFEKALTIDPTLTIAYINRGKALYNAGRKEEGCANWRQASTLGSGEAAALIRGLCQ